MSDKMALAAILIAAVCTFLLRALPFVAFAGERKLPLSLSAINGGIIPCSAFFWARQPICSLSDFCKLKTISVVLSTAMHLVECYNEPTNCLVSPVCYAQDHYGTYRRIRGGRHA